MAPSNKNRTVLKSYFVKNAIPTEGNFADLIDAPLNQAEDGVFRLDNEPLSVVAAPGQQRRALQLFSSYPADNADWQLSLNPPGGTGEGPRKGLGVADGAGSTRLFIDQATGHLGVGTNAPKNKLTVSGGDLSIEGGRYRRLKVVSDTYWAGIEIVARNRDGNQGHPHIDFTHGELDAPNFGLRLVAPTNDALTLTGGSLHVQDGALGVGTTEPQDRLTVNGGDLRLEGGRYRRLKVISDTYWAGIELVARNTDGEEGHPHIDFTHGDLDAPNFGLRLVAPTNDALTLTGGSLFLQDGALGVGTTQPQDRLTVNHGDLRVEGGRHRRLKVISDTKGAGIELVARNTDGNQGQPYIDFTHGDLDAPNYGLRLIATDNDALMLLGGSLHVKEGRLGVGTTEPQDKLTVRGGDLRVEGGAYRRLKVISDTSWAGLELVARNTDGK